MKENRDSKNIRNKILDGWDGRPPSKIEGGLEEVIEENIELDFANSVFQLSLEIDLPVKCH